MKTPTSIRSKQLLETTTSFCSALVSDPTPPPSDLIRRFFIPDPSPRSPRITEHGPEWARSRLPFLSKTFTGREECLEYFTLLGQTLVMYMSPGTFPSVESGEWVVDADEEGEGDGGVVSVVGKAKFKSLGTGNAWEEVFVYRFSGFDGEGRIGWWEIWADPLSAWVACDPSGFGGV